MLFKDSINYVSKNFEYKTDYSVYGITEVWTIIKQPPFIGDCEDYALTVLYHTVDKSILKLLWALLTLQAAIVGCRTYDEQPHAILRYKDRYTDNILQKSVSLDELKARGYKFNTIMFYVHWLPLVQIIKLLVGITIKKFKDR